MYACQISPSSTICYNDRRRTCSGHFDYKVNVAIQDNLFSTYLFSMYYFSMYSHRLTWKETNIELVHNNYFREHLECEMRLIISLKYVE